MTILFNMHPARLIAMKSAKITQKFRLAKEFQNGRMYAMDV